MLFRCSISHAGRRFIWSSLLFSMFGFSSTAFSLDREQVVRAKQSTALVIHSKGSASAFCISEQGMFVTSDHVVENANGQKITLALDPGGDSEATFTAKVLRRSKELDLAILKIDLGDRPAPPVLEFAEGEELFETQQLTAFGYPFGKALSAESGVLPAISVNLGRITSLRSKDGKLSAIQLDAQVNPGNSGGPLLDEDGKVVGIVSSGVLGAGVNFAVPVGSLLPLLEKPDVTISVPKISYDGRFDEVEVVAAVDWLGESPEEFDAELFVTIPGNSQQAKMVRGEDGRFRASFVPLRKSVGKKKPKLELRIHFEGGEIRGSATSVDIAVGEKTFPLEDIASIVGGDEPEVRPLNSDPVKGKASGLEELSIDLGGQTILVNGGKAQKILITPPEIVLPSMEYRVDIRSPGKLIASIGDKIELGAPKLKAVSLAQTKSALVSTVELSERREILLPGEITDLDVAGHGRYLILYMRDARKLAIFDTTTLKIRDYINLAEDPVVFAGGANHLLVHYPKANLLQRYSLETLEKDRTANNSFGPIDTMAIGQSAVRYGMILGSNEDRQFNRAGIMVIDLEKMAAVDVGAVESHSFLTGNQNALRASADGRTYGNTKLSGSPSGVGIITFSNGTLQTRYEHDSKGVVIPSADGSLIFTTYGGVFTPKYQQVIETTGSWSSGNHFIPSYHPMYFLEVPNEGTSMRGRDEEGQRGVQIYVKGSNQALVSLSDPFTEMKVDERPHGGVGKSPLTVDKRYHFIPEMNLLLTLPHSNDKIVVRPLNVHALLDEKEIDYLYVTSISPEAKANQRYSYELEVASRAGGIEFELQSGPEGLTLSPQGVVSWQVPEDATEETVIVLISDALGQESFYTFRIVVSG